MTARVSNVYDALEEIKKVAYTVCEEEGVSPLLMWMLLRQQADHELYLLQLDC